MTAPPPHGPRPESFCALGVLCVRHLPHAKGGGSHRFGAPERISHSDHRANVDQGVKITCTPDRGRQFSCKVPHFEWSPPSSTKKHCVFSLFKVEQIRANLFSTRKNTFGTKCQNLSFRANLKLDHSVRRLSAFPFGVLAKTIFTLPVSRNPRGVTGNFIPTTQSNFLTPDNAKITVRNHSAPKPASPTWGLSPRGCTPNGRVGAPRRPHPLQQARSESAPYQLPNCPVIDFQSLIWR